MSRSIYEGIFPFRKSAETQGVAQVGGRLEKPDLALSYLLAARTLLDSAPAGRLRDIAVPIAYLQRHAFELALKSVLSLAYEIRAERAWVAALENDENAERPADQDIPLIHNLDRLASLVGDALTAIGCGSLPSTLTDLTRQLHEAEGAEPTRLRYERLRDGRESFPKSTMLDVGHMQTALETAFEDHLVYRRDDDGREQNFLTSLVYEEMAEFQALLRLVPLDRLAM